MTASASEQTSRQGRVITFYSYKGGTGRSMAVANVAWILASQGKKVLVIDWDLEAPGLHRYFHPFLDDPELAASPGLIDYFYDVVSAASAQSDAITESENAEKPWWHSWTSLLRYSYPLKADFLSLDTTAAKRFGTIELIPAGRQSPDYGERVGQFDWRSFYQRLGGGVLLEAVKRRLRERYDYVLIDSRTGLSDTAGICTVQMPDDLVVCFTLNRQSVAGAAAVAHSAMSQRMRREDVRGLRIWPLPTRVDLAERERLEAARTVARTAFLQHIGPLVDSREERDVYWGRAEVLYQPFFAYEEVLAVFAERKHQTASMLSSLEFLTGRLTDGAVTELGRLNDSARGKALSGFMLPVAAETATGASEDLVYVSYDYDLENVVVLPLVNRLKRMGIKVFFYPERIKPGDSIAATIEAGLASATLMLRLIGLTHVPGKWGAFELEHALKAKMRVIPVLCGGAGFKQLPEELLDRHAMSLAHPASQDDMDALVQTVADVLRRPSASTPSVDSDDPQKGRWGGMSRRTGRLLSASVTAIDDTWYAINLEVRATDATALAGTVTFHLHPTFQPSICPVQVKDGVASLRLTAWGAFTVGAEADQGRTVLELDLAEESSAPALFRAR